MKLGCIYKSERTQVLQTCNSTLLWKPDPCSTRFTLACVVYCNWLDVFFAEVLASETIVTFQMEYCTTNGEVKRKTVVPLYK